MENSEADILHQVLRDIMLGPLTNETADQHTYYTRVLTINPHTILIEVQQPTPIIELVEKYSDTNSALICIKRETSEGHILELDFGYYDGEFEVVNYTQTTAAKLKSVQPTVN